MRTTRTLWSQDNFAVLAGLETGSAALAYLDPPFNSGRSFEAVLGQGSESPQEAFSDMWTWGEEAERDLLQLDQSLPRQAADLVRAIVAALGKVDLAAYLVMMTPRLGELRRVLADNGSIYVHCDPSASHYLKIVLDHIFGPENFRNELVWKRTHAHSGSRRFGPVHDVILFYSKSKNYLWNQGHSPYSSDYIEKYFRKTDERGAYQLITCTGPGSRVGTRAHYEWRGQWPPANRHWAWTEDVMEQADREGRLEYSSKGTPRLKRYVDEGKGVRLQDLWLDINPLGAHEHERTGYETQKPVRLLERIIEAGSNTGDLVIDPFCGSGTTAVAAEKLGRSWIAVDSSLLAASLTLARVRHSGSDAPVALHGFPASEGAILKVQERDPTAFAVWGTGMLGTLVNKNRLTQKLASGVSCLEARSSRRTLVSWVPLSKDLSGLRDANLYRDSADCRAVLVSDSASRALHGWISSQVGERVHAVELKSLLGVEAARLGMAPVLASL